ncbi:hypothetical protein CJF31_00000690 [Rutstroemia sp. NJR-2017a BVV2]|nr:hypothetical protein CJF31_00000690 [Rutstroemia sp. NJR-2017a BVV2]
MIRLNIYIRMILFPFLSNYYLY